MGGIFLSFLVPQAIALTNNPSFVSPQAVDRILIHSCLCVAMCWLGYLFKPKLKWLAKINVPMDIRRLTQAAWVLVLFGRVCSFLLGQITIQTTGAGTWTGPATILLFFSQTSLIGAAILLIVALGDRYRPWVNLLGVGIALWPTLFSVIEYGRRQPTATVLIIIGLGLYFTRNITPPRWLVLGLVILSASLIPLIGQLRGGFWDALFTGNLAINDLRLAFNNLLEGQTLELRNAALIAEAASRTNQYGYGTGFWNSIVFQYVPGQLVGYDVKEFLYINLTNFSLTDLFGYDTPTGTTLTGVGDSFREFSYFGCFIFALIAYWFKNLWVAAVSFRSIYSQILYIGLVSPALVGLTHGIGRFLQEAIFQVILITLVSRYARQKNADPPQWIAAQSTSEQSLHQ
ncbi:hypothetical protein [Picosynechococcus sp. PCC 8807]|uniref:hypothetical protein n=1 Tax=Picosynechococcus sp. PCC 8807 TaxID=195248 RepID=UPI0018DC41E8|nr:hypothetical protein [Picosynechococcus sp. PCC 8807]